MKRLIQAASGDKPRRFRVEAYNGGLLPVDGFEHPVVVDLTGLEAPNQIPILIDHRKEVEATLGITDKIENTGTAPECWSLLIFQREKSSV
jgi:hypothetical protein